MEQITKIIEETSVHTLDHVSWILFFSKNCTDESLKDVNRLKGGVGGANAYKLSALSA